MKATGTVEAHFIPSINLKVSALGDIVEAGVFLELDASANMKLSLEAQAEGSITVNRPRAEPAIKGRYWAADAIPAVGKRAELEAVKPVFVPAIPAVSPPAKGTLVAVAPAISTPASGTFSKAAPVITNPAKGILVEATSAKDTPTKGTPVKGTPVKATSVKVISTKDSASILPTSTKAPETAAPSGTAPAKNNDPSVVKDGSASFGGCFEIGAGLDVNAGADANFFGLFDKGTKVSLFSRKFEILKVSSYLWFPSSSR